MIFLVNNLAKPIVALLGAGGHASVLMDILEQNNIYVNCVYAPKLDRMRSIFDRVNISKDENEILKFSANDIRLVNGLGFLPNTDARKKIHEKFKSLGYEFLSVISRTAEVSRQAKLGFGVQILNGSIVQTGARIGDGTIVNTNVTVEHDCVIGDLNHLAPSATLCGGVRTGNNVFIGAGAVVLPGSRISDNATVRAGSIHFPN